ncbi:hypothetical protein E3N88_28775 [Mikania micrantha]|uniref:Uncharacterized protein n=1 Tax=Mikania micrantha TaxID=192012 RepID=A0A5N6N221_9ASTR|nr:hypothetical protein E3N88_28775 [Mikania micrantha]
MTTLLPGAIVSSVLQQVSAAVVVVRFYTNGGGCAAARHSRADTILHQSHKNFLVDAQRVVVSGSRWWSEVFVVVGGPQLVVSGAQSILNQLSEAAGVDEVLCNRTSARISTRAVSRVMTKILSRRMRRNGKKGHIMVMVAKVPKRQYCCGLQLWQKKKKDEVGSGVNNGATYGFLFWFSDTKINMV